MGLKLPEPFGTEPLTHNRVVVKDSTAELKQYPNLYETGTEPLEPEEMRVTALGTGYPARRGQAAAGLLVELGNGEVFIFDAGAGTNSAFHHMRVPYSRATKFFISHYHLDHIADLIAYYDFGQSNGRLEPMQLHGPSGEKPELGMNALVENIYKFAAWHDRTKYGNLDTRGFDMTPYEFEPDQAKTAIIFAGIVIEDAVLPGADTIIDVVMITVGLSVFVHGATSWFGSESYADWYEREERCDPEIPEAAGAPNTPTRSLIDTPTTSSDTGDDTP